jgi:hypothetical protein
MRLVISLALVCTHAFVNTPSPRPLTRLRAAPAQDTVRLQKKISAFEAEVKLKQTLVSKLEADLAAAREAARVAEAELRTAKQELAGVVPLKKSRRDEVPIQTSRAPNVDAFVQEKRAQIDQAAAEKRLRDEEAAERRFRESAERRRELEKARSERQVSQAKKMLEKDAEKELYGETLYDLLGVARDASAADVKQGYRKAAASCHPDTNSSNPEKYSRIMDAYDVLKDAERRKKYDAELDLDKAIEGTFTFVASVVDSVSSINSPSEDDEDSCDVDDNSLACQFERRANACLEVFSEEHMVLPSTGSRIRLSPDGAQLVVRQTAVERLLRKDPDVSYNITSLKLATRSEDVLTLGFLDASELRILFASPDEAEQALIKLATDVVAPLNELRAKAAAPGAIGALGGLAMAGAAGLAFAGILEVETAMATAGAVAALGGAVASSVAAEVSSAKESEGDA